MSYDIEELMRNKLEMDDTFEFGCDTCGKCCHRDELLLSGYDIYSISKHLNKTMEEIIKENCFIYIGHDSKLPIVSVKPRVGDNSCRFLRKGKCTIHEIKPTTCALFPLGRIYDSRVKDYIYFKQDIGCGNKEKHTLKEWLESINIEEIDRMSKPWGTALLDISLYLQGIKDKERLKYITNLIFIGLYLNYDTSKDYVEQLEKNISDLEQLLPKFKRTNKG